MSTKVKKAKKTASKKVAAKKKTSTTKKPAAAKKKVSAKKGPTPVKAEAVVSVNDQNVVVVDAATQS